MQMTQTELKALSFAIMADRIAIEKITDKSLEAHIANESYDTWKRMSYNAFLEAGFEHNQIKQFVTLA